MGSEDVEEEGSEDVEEESPSSFEVGVSSAVTLTTSASNHAPMLRSRASTLSPTCVCVCVWPVAMVTFSLLKPLAAEMGNSFVDHQ